MILYQRYADTHGEEDVMKLADRTGISKSFSIDGKKTVAYLVERQNDGTSKVVEQNLKNGVPFTSFSEAVRESMRVEDILEEAFES